MYIKIFFYIEKLQTQIQEITNQLQILHLKQIQVIHPEAFHKDLISHATRNSCV